MHVLKYIQHTIRGVEQHRLINWLSLNSPFRPPSIPAASSLTRRPISKLVNKENKIAATTDPKKTMSAADDKLNSAPLEEAK